jgi:cytochrome P450
MKGTETAFASNQYVVETLRHLVERKRVTSGHDLASWFISHSAGLDDDEVLEHLRLILVAANETTVNLIANTLRMVLIDPRFRASLTGGHMTLPDAVEQVLWDEPPLLTIPGRWATGDTEIGGQKIKAGDMLLLSLAAGNIDPAVRPDPAVPMHGNRSHLAFSGGPHECPGQDIGRAIADTGIDTLLTRLPDLRLTTPEGELHWNATWLTRHLTALPVQFTARGGDIAAVSSTTPEAATTTKPILPGPRTSSVSTEGTTEPVLAATAPERRSPWWDSLKGWLRRG